MPPLLPDEATKAQETFRLGDRFYVEEHGLVLGELIPVVSETSNGLAWKGGFIDRPKITSNMSIDNYTNPGMYGLDGCQDSPYKYGGLIIFRANVLVVQIVYDMQGSNRPQYRQNWANQGWQSWYSF